MRLSPTAGIKFLDKSTSPHLLRLRAALATTLAHPLSHRHRKPGNPPTPGNRANLQPRRNLRSKKTKTPPRFPTYYTMSTDSTDADLQFSRETGRGCAGCRCDRSATGWMAATLTLVAVVIGLTVTVAVGNSPSTPAASHQHRVPLPRVPPDRSGRRAAPAGGTRL